MSREGSIHVNCRSNLDDDPLVSATYGLINYIKYIIVYRLVVSESNSPI
jgi:hypothetical protein